MDISISASLRQALDLISPQPDSSHSAPAYEHSVSDVIATRCILQYHKKLPPLLVDIIFDLAEYWPHSTTEIDNENNPNDAPSAVGGTTRERTFLIRSPPLGFDTLPEKLCWGGYKNEELVHPHISDEEKMPREFLEDLIERHGQAIPRIQKPGRKVVFTLTSHDQGWATDGGKKGSYNNSWTFFEAGLERFRKAFKKNGELGFDVDEKDGDESPKDDALSKEPYAPAFYLPFWSLTYIYPVPPSPPSTPPTRSNALRAAYCLEPDPRYLVQTNKCAVSNPTTYRIVWSWNDDVMNPDSPEADKLVDLGRGKESASGEFVRDLRIGDVVTLWAHARFVGWRNTVLKAKVEVYWAL